MSKSILLVDTPDSCGKCMFLAVDGEEKYCSFGCWKDDVYELDEKPKCCPLKPIPEKKDLKELEKHSIGEDYIWSEGYNACIDEILSNKTEQTSYYSKKVGDAFRSVFTKIKEDEAKEKQIAKKPVLLNGYNTCPNCMRIFFEINVSTGKQVHDRYCKFCGQRLDWGTDMTRINEMEKELFGVEEPEEKFDENNPYNLGHISTSTLKTELRRRKKWNNHTNNNYSKE